ncbi:hypothetical protein N7491_008813 [Penicillium cf. griseofulvum]|nr:hypothetical protein N7491_008813 [Penicillium cf. griseofulvum]
MSSFEPHRIFLITEILELILLETDTRTLLASAQRVCRKWHSLIQDSSDLQAALFFKPVNYTLPRGTPGIRNPLLQECIWPWFCARQARNWKAPPVEGGVKIPQIDPQRDGWSLSPKRCKLETNQPPRSCIGFIEKDGKVINGSAYTEVKVQPRGGQDHLRLGDVMLPYNKILSEVHPLPDEGLLWHGFIRKKELERYAWESHYPTDDEKYGEIPRSQVAYATKYLRDCDIAFFILECGRIRGQWVSEYGTVMLHFWLCQSWMSLCAWADFYSDADDLAF